MTLISHDRRRYECYANLLHKTPLRQVVSYAAPVNRRDSFQLLRFEDVFREYCKFNCYDPRDHVHGLVGITDWKGEVPPEPNYAEPVTLLAAKCIKHFDWQECQFSMLWTATETLLATLGITIEDRIMAALLKLRRAGSAHDEFMRLALADEHAYQSNSLLPRAGWVDVTESSLLQRLDTGQLILTWSDQHQENRLQGAEWHDLYDRWRRVVNASRPKMGVQELLARNHITIGLACSEARSGDTVVALPITPPGSIRRCLILRPGDAQTCEIVGQAIVNGVYIPAYGSVSFHERLRDALSDTNTRRIDSIEDITFNFYFSEVDWLLLVAQGASVETLSDPSPKNGTMDLELGRLERSVTHAPLSSYVTRVQDSRKRRELRRMQFGTSGQTSQHTFDPCQAQRVVDM